VALYAALGDAELEAIAAAYGLPGPFRATGIPQGSINTNYRLETPGGRLFLRHTTVRSADDLRFEAALLHHLEESQYPAPHLVPAKDGAPFFEIAGGRVTLFHYLPGEELTRDRLAPEHLERLGAEVGKLHRVGNSFIGDRQNPYSPQVVRDWLLELEIHKAPELRAIARELLQLLERAVRPFAGVIPRGVIHADIFMDNVKWLGDRVAAIFDFEMACRDALALDLAITLNAWCFDGGYQPALASALVRGYEQERKLTPPEREHLFEYALFGAVRYTASRIRDFHLSPLPPERLFPKDFRTYLARARQLSAMGPQKFRKMAMP